MSADPRQPTAPRASPTLARGVQRGDDMSPTTASPDRSTPRSPVAGRTPDAAEPPTTARRVRSWILASVRLLARAGVLALAASALPAAGCELDDEPRASTETAEATLAPADPSELSACEVTPHCVFKVQGPLTDAVQSQLGCDQQYYYGSGAPGGFLGGIGSFCVDSADNRKALRAARARGYVAPYCNTCLTVPGDKLFVFWSIFEGPGCPSGCSQGTAPVWLGPDTVRPPPTT